MFIKIKEIHKMHLLFSHGFHNIKSRRNQPKSSFYNHRPNAFFLKIHVYRHSQKMIFLQLVLNITEIFDFFISILQGEFGIVIIPVA
jgi:hypothetical protein